jgi:hypothetical protein
MPARQRQEAVLELLDAEGKRIGRDHVSHEEAVGGAVRVVADFGQPAAPGGDQPAHGGDEADPVRAGDGQDVLAWRAVHGGGCPHWCSAR